MMLVECMVASLMMLVDCMVASLMILMLVECMVTILMMLVGQPHDVGGVHGGQPLDVGDMHGGQPHDSLMFFMEVVTIILHTAVDRSPECTPSELSGRS